MVRLTGSDINRKKKEGKKRSGGKRKGNVLNYS